MRVRRTSEAVQQTTRWASTGNVRQVGLGWGREPRVTASPASRRITAMQRGLPRRQIRPIPFQAWGIATRDQGLSNAAGPAATHVRRMDTNTSIQARILCTVPQPGSRTWVAPAPRSRVDRVNPPPILSRLSVSICRGHAGGWCSQHSAAPRVQCRPCEGMPACANTGARVMSTTGAGPSVRSATVLDFAGRPCSVSCCTS